ncbi:MAG: VWA domain-containing protein, partial [Singulisphaera sp.]
MLPGFANPVRLSLTVDLDESVAAVADLRVSLHVAYDGEGDGVRRVTLVPGERLDRDFILRFRLGGAAARTSLSLHPDADPDSGEGTFALTVVPPEGEWAPTRRPRDVAFVLDRSGSMKGWKMVAARRAMARMVDSLSEIDRFTVLAFDDRIETPGWGDKELVPATDRNRFRAVEFLSGITDRGGTEMDKPLGRAAQLLADSGPCRDRVLVLVTDGQVANEDYLLRALVPHLDGVRVFTLGIDQAVNEGFLRRLAEVGGGSCELVESEDRLDAVMELVHRRIGTPMLTDLRLDSDALGVVADSLVPDGSPCLFAGSPLLLLGRYRDASGRPVVVRAEAPDDPQWLEAVAPAQRRVPPLATARAP